jgi:hypothetical protein
METPEDRSQPACPEGKSPWERPTVTLAGTIALLVRAGSAQGKISGAFDGDMSQFQACNPQTDPMCHH